MKMNPPKYPYLVDKERRKQVILLSVYLDKKKNQKHIISLEVERLPGLRRCREVRRRRRRRR